MKVVFIRGTVESVVSAFSFIAINVQWQNKTMKTTFDFDFDYMNLLNSMDTHKHRTPEKLSYKKVLFDYL